MPSFVISAVDTSANTLTSTGVAAAGGALGTVLTSGDRMRLRNVGGAFPAATPSLAGATDYYARRVTDDSIQVYDTNAHALAGGSTGLVDLSGSGSGTTTIEFSLPYAMPTVIPADGTPLSGAQVAAAWNSLVALYDLLTGQAQSVIIGATVASFSAPDVTEHVPLDIFIAVNWAPVTLSSQNYLESSGGGGCHITIPSRSGWVLKSVTFACRAAVAAALSSVDVQKMFNDATSGASIGSPTPPTLTTTWADFTIDVTDTTVTDAFDLYLILSAANTGVRVKNIRAVYARPQL